MLMYVFPIVLVVTSNIVYHICQKSMPQSANPLSALLVAYLTAAIVVLVAFPFFKTDKGFFQSFTQLNWTSFALGVAIVGLELGWLLAYRVGWNVSVGSLVANIALAIMLIPVGILFYKEIFSITQIAGVAFCMVGLVLINR